MTVRGIRNMNPGNIRLGESWLGLRTKQTDPDFCQFTSMVYGCRALLKLLRTYVEKRGCTTIRKVIERWAPPSENDTSSYVLSVAAACRRDPDERLPVDVDPLIYLDLARAIARHECGPEAEGIWDDVWEAAAKEAGL
ncbi:structural protein P5 [Sutterella wadsworthensis]|uniref:structural protein P5 n=1 Tax=Sutterella wadsworthensis TaxID=40545 RepID=UPI0030807396